MSDVRTPDTALLDRADVRALVIEWARQCGTRVRARRVDLGVDRRHLAAIAGTTEATIQRIESGFINPRDALRFTISAALDLDVADLWSYPSVQRIQHLLGADQ